jgi:polyribonucleotide nucleotidyltransferase
MLKMEQQLDTLNPENHKRYMHNYNFPPYSTGETGRVGTPKRREIGHGALAERALKAVLPLHENFPYTIRIVSEILESNGSSSMASVCSGSMALMDCGVPIKAPVSGIAMGLLINENGYVILSDIQGLEDHYGDMDFKVAGTEKGVTALQLDIKVAGLSKNILEEALAQAKEGRLFILRTMNQTISSHRPELAANAPKIHTFNIDPEKVGLIIGPGGKMIRKIEEESGATVMVTNGSTGEVTIAAKNKECMEKALNAILALTKEVEVGEVYNGTVMKILTFGAFVELLPGKEGLIHISKLSEQRLSRVEDVLNVGDKIRVIVDQIDNQNRINLVPETRFS